MKLNSKLMIMAALIGIPLAVIAVVFILMTQRALKLKIRDSHMDLATHLAQRADVFSSDNERYITTFIYNIDQGEGGDAAAPEEQLVPLMPQFESFRTMTVMDAQGKVLAHVTGADVTAPSDISAHMSRIPADRVIAKKQAYRSEPYPDSTGRELVRTVAFPFADGKRLLAVEVSLAPLQDMIAEVKFSRHGSAFLVDATGRLAAAANPERAVAREDMTRIPLIKSALGKASSGVAEFKDISGQAMLGAYHPVQGGWLVVVQEPARDAYYTAARMKNLAAMAVLASALFALLTGVFIARSILGPMSLLMSGTEHLSRGDLDFTVPIRSRDEMGRLAGAFNQMTQSLSKRDRDIAHINNKTKDLAAILNRQSLAAAALGTMADITRARTLGILIADRNTGRLDLLLRVEGLIMENPALPDHLDAAVRRATSRGEAESGDDAAHGPFLAMPLMFENRVMGALVVADPDPGNTFSKTDLDLFGIIASSVAISVQNIELIEDTVEKTRMEQELQTAELLQQTLFPKCAPEIPGLELKGFIESASETGGDWYGFVHEPENRRVAILIADVTGHGVPAALVTATTNSFFRTLEVLRAYSRQGGEGFNAPPIPAYRQGFDPLSPDFMLRCLNEIIHKTTDGKLVMTLFASVYYYDEKRLVYANAGHNLPLVFRESGLSTNKKKDKKIGYLVSKGVRLGDEPGVTFREHEFLLQEGDAILWYTDGLIECLSPEGEEFGEARLKHVFEHAAPHGVDTIFDTVLDRARSFFEDQPHVDDITMVVGKCVAVEAGTEPWESLVRTSTDLGIRRALLVSEDIRFSKQITWFLTGHGADVAHFATAAEAMKFAVSEPVDLCIAPLGGGIEQVSLATLLKEKNPAAHFLFITSVPFDNMLPMLLELGLPLQLVHTDCENLLTAVQTAAAKLFSVPFWGIRQYLGRGAQIHSLKIRNTATRMSEARPLIEFGRRIGMDGHMLHSLAGITDELLMNAMFDAPRDHKGNPKYAAMERTQEVQLSELEAPVLEFGSDGNHLAIGVTDPFGQLDRATVLSYLEKCLFSEVMQIDDKAGGAGLGLFQIFRAVDMLVFNVHPGYRTEVIGLMKLKLDAKFTRRRLEALCYFERKD